MACNYSNPVLIDNSICNYPLEYYDCSGLCIIDTDCDGICDGIDNCAWFSNPLQIDSDFDGIGDICDPEPFIMMPWNEPIITNCNSTLALTPDNNILVDGQPITIGDYIGLFYTDDNGELQCGGLGMWTGEPTSIAIWGDDSYTPEKDGFLENELIAWMVWDSETDEIMTNVTVEYTMGSSYWSCNGLIVISDLIANNIFSANIHPGGLVFMVNIYRTF